jgi:hypothetical protein
MQAALNIEPFHCFDDDVKDELAPDLLVGVAMNRELGLLYIQAVELNIIMKMKEKQRELAILKTFLFSRGYPAGLDEAIGCGITIEDYWRTIDWIREETSLEQSRNV